MSGRPDRRDIAIALLALAILLAILLRYTIFW